MQAGKLHQTLIFSAWVFASVTGCSAGSSVPEGVAAAAVEEPPIHSRAPNVPEFKAAFAEQTRAPERRSKQAFEVAVFASGIRSGWAFEFMPDGRILLSEKSGELRIIGSDGRRSPPISGLPPVDSGGQGGLLDVALDPDFATNSTIYWSFAEPRQGGNGTSLAKAVLRFDGAGARLESVQVLFRQQPTHDSNLHFGSRIVFAPDGMLFLTTGERSDRETRVGAQDLGTHLGKVIRIRRDGSVPADNPFVSRAGALPEVWSYGHRNMQGAALDGQGRLWTIEHGPRGGDELNLIKPGVNYGWPVISYGIEYSGRKIGDGITARAGLEQPVYYWDPVIAPSGITFYDGDMFPEWKGNLFIASLLDMKLVRLELANDKVVGEEWLLRGRKQRIRDVKQAPDGSLYVLTEAGDGALLRISRPSK
jgi:aldose sugar dehydrogenase